VRHEEGGLIYPTGSTDLWAKQFPDLPRPSSSPYQFRPFGRLKKAKVLVQARYKGDTVRQTVSSRMLAGCRTVSVGRAQRASIGQSSCFRIQTHGTEQPQDSRGPHFAEPLCTLCVAVLSNLRSAIADLDEVELRLTVRHPTYILKVTPFAGLYRPTRSTGINEELTTSGDILPSTKPGMDSLSVRMATPHPRSPRCG
jgi:hypothetical protein